MQFPLELLKNETSQAPSLALQKIYWLKLALKSDQGLVLRQM